MYTTAFSNNGKFFATGSYDNTFKIWSVEKGYDLIKTVEGHSDVILSVTFSKDSKYFVTSSGDKNCKVWNTEK